MTHRSMTAIADGLEDLGGATLRYQFPYMERGSAQGTVRAAVAEARRHAGTLPLFAGERSFASRMTSQAQAAEPFADANWSSSLFRFTPPASRQRRVLNLQ